MGIRKKRAVLVALVLALVGVTAGCDLATLSYFFTPEQRVAAKMKHLASADKKVEPKVVILTYTQASDVPIEFLHADRLIAEQLGRNLMDFAKASEERISILP